jgi:hypothetical protein
MVVFMFRKYHLFLDEEFAKQAETAKTALLLPEGIGKQVNFADFFTYFGDSKTLASVPKHLTLEGKSSKNKGPWAINSAVECYLHTVEVTGSNPVSPTILPLHS